MKTTVVPTFEGVARTWHQHYRKRWSRDHARTIMRRLELNLFPAIGHVPVDQIKAPCLMRTISQVEQRGSEIAARVLQYGTRILNYAVCHGYRDDNPAMMLRDAILPPARKHRAALPLDRLPELMMRLEHIQNAVIRLAIEINLHTFVRSSELRYARWQEIDLQQGIWEIPAIRTEVAGVRYAWRGSKMKTPHLVPLSRQVVSLFSKLRQYHPEDVAPDSFVFISQAYQTSKPMSENSINVTLRQLGYDTASEVCGHGFRAMACSALYESGRFNRDAIERQMSHQERNSVRAAYVHKAEYLSERKAIMQWWSDYLSVCQTGRYYLPDEFTGKQDWC